MKVENKETMSHEVLTHKSQNIFRCTTVMDLNLLYPQGKRFLENVQRYLPDI